MYKPYRGFAPQPSIRANERIRAREVLVIDPTGKSLGVLPISDALYQARRHQLDLVEVSPNATPPVCKILDFGKYRYEAAKRDRDARKGSGATKVKELKFHINIDDHDYSTKMRHAEQFMFKGMRVKFLMVLRGREMVHKDIGEGLIRKIRADLSHVGIADFEPKLLGKTITMMLSPLPAQKRERKYTVEEVDEEIDSDTDEEQGQEARVSEKKLE